MCLLPFSAAAQEVETLPSEVAAPVAATLADAHVAADSLRSCSWVSPYIFPPMSRLGAFPAPYGSLPVLHEGFNAAFSLSMSAAFGRGAPRGVGFGQTAAFAYASPIGKRFFAAAGLYASRLSWGGTADTGIGIGALVGYKVNDRLDVYAYANRRLTPENRPLHFGHPYAYLGVPKQEFGAAAQFKFKDSTFLTISVSHTTYDDFFQPSFFARPGSQLRPYGSPEW